VEAEMNKVKWKLIADKMKQNGGSVYSVSHTFSRFGSAEELLMTDSPTTSSASTRR
jgi:hypothetical protein